MHVSINPYTSDLPGGPLYGIPALEPGAPVEDALGEEHPGQAALAARRRILAGGAGTCFLMTGESGSGKTEATRGILALFSGLAGGGTGEAPDAAVSPVTVVGEKAAAGGALFLAGNLLVEALGCAKTERNDNSSRFGKRVTVRFSRATGAVSGTRHRAFLLEASRVLAHGASERSFHAFYAIFRGPGAEGEAPRRKRSPARLPVPQPRRQQPLPTPKCTETWQPDCPPSESRRRSRRTASGPSWRASCTSRRSRFRRPPRSGRAGLCCKRAAGVVVSTTWRRWRRRRGRSGRLPACWRRCSRRARRRSAPAARRQPAEVITSRHSAAKAAAVRDGLAVGLYQALFEWVIALVNAGSADEKLVWRFLVLRLLLTMLRCG
ncbi:Myosin IF heavy chain [Diplonema papillatum]|nr:Myosin IF heavy chain [Diplonema papillatum]